MDQVLVVSQEGHQQVKQPKTYRQLDDSINGCGLNNKLKATKRCSDKTKPANSQKIKSVNHALDNDPKTLLPHFSTSD